MTTISFRAIQVIEDISLSSAMPWSAGDALSYDVCVREGEKLSYCKFEGFLLERRPEVGRVNAYPGERYVPGNLIKERVSHPRSAYVCRSQPLLPMTANQSHTYAGTKLPSKQRQRPTICLPWYLFFRNKIMLLFIISQSEACLQYPLSHFCRCKQIGITKGHLRFMCYIFKIQNIRHLSNIW